MRTACILSLMMSPLLVLGSPPGSTIREGGIKVGTGRNTPPKGVNIGRGNSAVRIGEGRLTNSTRQRPFLTTSTTTTAPPIRFTYSPQSSITNNHDITDLKVGMMVPYKSFGTREYTRAVTTAINALQRSTRGPRLGFFQRYDLHVKVETKELTPSPNDHK